MKNLGKLLSPNDPALVEKTLHRLTEQDTWNDVFSTKLIELLDNIDGIKAEIRQRARDADKGLVVTSTRLRVITPILCFAIALSWVIAIWVAWSAHPISFAVPVLASIGIVVLAVWLVRWLLNAT